MNLFNRVKNTDKNIISDSSIRLIPNVMCFSDNIIISKLHDEIIEKSYHPHSLDSAVHSTLCKVSEYCFRALEVGFVLRGAVGYGDLYLNISEKSSVIFGSELIDSIHDEKDKAKFPRVIISDSLLEKLPKSCIDIKKDKDEKYFIPFLYQWLGKYILDGHVERIEAIRDQIGNNFKTAGKDVKDKWIWLVEYYNLTINELEIEHTSPDRKCEFQKCKCSKIENFEMLKINLENENFWVKLIKFYRKIQTT